MSMLKQRTRGSRSGQVIVVAAFAVIVVGAIAALAIDIGFFYVERARLQNAADAAVLAASQKLVSERNDGADEDTARAAAEAHGELFSELNVEEGICSIQFGEIDDDGNFVETAGLDEVDVVRAVVRREDIEGESSSLNTYFASLFGMDNVEAEAEAMVNIVHGVNTMRQILAPFAVDEASVADAQAGNGEIMIYTDEKVSPGCMGLLDLDGGANSASDIAEWILNGYPGEVTIDLDSGYVWIDGTPGLKSSMKDEAEERIGDLLYVCVYDNVTGNGSNTQFRIVSFIAVTLLDVKMTGKNKYLLARLEEVVNAPLADGDGSGSGNLVRTYLVN